MVLSLDYILHQKQESINISVPVRQDTRAYLPYREKSGSSCVQFQTLIKPWDAIIKR